MQPFMKNLGEPLAVVHFWSATGGFGKRYRMLLDALGEAFDLTHIPSPQVLFRLLFRRWTSGMRLVFFTSLMAPVAGIVRLVQPSCRLLYFIRGDEYGWAVNERRYVRGALALVFQKWLSLLRCRFVFVSEDLLCRFEQRLGPIHDKVVLPNTVGRVLPASRPVSRRLGLVGDFESVKNIEWALASLSRGMFDVALFGNHRLPARWKRPWLTAHGLSENLARDLAMHCDLVVLCSVSEGFPNVLIDACEAGCSVVMPFGYPFAALPIVPEWRVEMDGLTAALARESAGHESQLERRLLTLLREQRNFHADNPALFELLESDWNERVRAVV
jgi:hypothetical protein